MTLKKDMGFFMRIDRATSAFLDTVPNKSAYVMDAIKEKRLRDALRKELSNLDINQGEEDGLGN